MKSIATKIMFLSLTLSTAALANSPEEDNGGELTIVGNGEASAEPEYARLSINVTSICYETSQAAKDANAQLANKLIASLQTFVAGQDRVTTTGGANVLQTETHYTGSDTHTLCVMKWRATNTINLKLTAIDRLAEAQDAVLSVIDTSHSIDVDQKSQTYAEIYRPSFHLTAATHKALRAQAQVMAYEDAKLQFDTFADHCQLANARLTIIEPPTYESYPRMAGARFADAAASETPIIPDDILVSASWRFRWSFTPTASCPL